MNEPERKLPNELMIVKNAMTETWNEGRPVESRSYPYFNPPYEIPFSHIGTEKQVFLDNFIQHPLVTGLNGKRKLFKSGFFNFF